MLGRFCVLLFALQIGMARVERCSRIGDRREACKERFANALCENPRLTNIIVVFAGRENERKFSPFIAVQIKKCVFDRSTLLSCCDFCCAGLWMQPHKNLSQY